MNMARLGATQTHSQPHHPGLPWVTSSLQFTNPATGEDSLSGGSGWEATCKAAPGAPGKARLDFPSAGTLLHGPRQKGEEGTREG